MSKRIVICSDGTWNSPVDGETTNVLKLSRAIKPVASDKKAQVVFYDWGVGTDAHKITGGAFGVGLDKNIQDAYRFMVHNYNPGDELFLFGFSRGAYTVRSLAGFIRNVGVLKRANAGLIQKAYDLYRSRSKPDSERSRKFRKDNSWANETPIYFLGVWDTVGSLGIPFSFLGFLNDKYEFHDTKLSRIIEHARHAVSIDEKRDDFKPTLWDLKNKKEDIKQVWFAGVHSDVGGGFKESGLSDIALKWMIQEAKALGLTVENYLKPNPEFDGKLHKSYKGAYRLLGKFQRPMKEYGKLDLHPAVKQRYTNDSSYRPKNLVEYLDEYGW